MISQSDYFVHMLTSMNKEPIRTRQAILKDGPPAHVDSLQELFCKYVIRP